MALRLCADPATLDRLRSGVGASTSAMAAELRHARAEIAVLRKKLAAAEGALRSRDANLSSIGLSVAEERLYRALLVTDRPVSPEDLALAASSNGQPIAIETVRTVAKNVRRKLAAAGEAYTIRGERGIGYQLIPVAAG